MEFPSDLNYRWTWTSKGPPLEFLAPYADGDLYMQFIHMKEHVAINNQYKINTTNLVQYKYSSTVNVYNQMRILVMLCSESF